LLLLLMLWLSPAAQVVVSALFWLSPGAEGNASHLNALQHGPVLAALCCYAAEAAVVAVTSCSN
jgi:hypothetical protein